MSETRQEEVDVRFLNRNDWTDCQNDEAVVGDVYRYDNRKAVYGMYSVLVIK